MPVTPGSYEFRLFLNNGYTRLATSPAITVLPATNPVPVTGAISPASTIAGAQPLTITISGSGFVASSIVRWNGADRPTTFVTANQLRVVITEFPVVAVITPRRSRRPRRPIRFSPRGP